MDGKEKEKTQQGRFVSVGVASISTGLSIQTIRKLVDNKEIAGFKTSKGTRRIDREGIQELCCNAVLACKSKDVEKKNFVYARVSTKKQMDDLSRQVEYLNRPEYSSYLSVSDIGSGINFKRKGLSIILDACIQGSIGELVVAHRDRLSRFGFDLIEIIVKKAGGKITVLDHKQVVASANEELAEDLLSIIHIYSCRQMGKRSYHARQKRLDESNQDKDVSDSYAKEIAN